MKTMLKYMLVILVLCVLSVSCKSLPVSERNQDFVILNTKDTVYGDKVRGVKWFNKLGRVTIINGDGKNKTKKVYPYDEIYQIHYFDRKNRSQIVEIIEETPSLAATHVEMDVIINSGKVRLYLNDPGFRPDYPFVVSDFYHGYVNRNSQRKELLEKLEAKEKDLKAEHDRLVALQKELDARSKRVDELEAALAAKDANMKALKESISKALTNFEFATGLMI